MNNIYKRILENAGNFRSQNIFILGTGGGSDIISALLLAALLQQQTERKFTFTFGGMLSPASQHFYDSAPEQIINIVRKPNSLIGESTSGLKRFLFGNPIGKEISFVDNHIWAFVNYFNSILDMHGLRTIEVKEVVHFSTQFGSLKLCDEFRKWSYDKFGCVVGLDVGGDITATIDNNNILSPMMDLTALYMLNSAWVQDRVLIEMGWGSDGESKNKNIRESFDDVSFVKEEIDLSIENVDVFRSFKKLFVDYVSSIRSGHTIPLLIRHVLDPIDHNESTHTHTYHTYGGICRHETKVQTGLDASKMFLIDVFELFKKRRELMFGYHGVLVYGLALKIKNQYWSSEVDGQYIPHILESKGMFNFKPNVKTLWGFGLFSRNLSADIRSVLISSICLKERCDGVVIYRDDYDRLRVDTQSGIKIPHILDSREYNGIVFLKFSENVELDPIIDELKRVIVGQPIDWLERDGVLSLNIDGNFSAAQLRKVIPVGAYCYDKDGVCPFWTRFDRGDQHSQNNGYCYLLQKGDWGPNGVSLLFDQCKCCGINEPEEE